MEQERKPLGEILMHKGFINRAQLTEALEYQHRLPHGNHMPLGEILISFDYLTEAQLHEALGVQPAFRQKPVGEILVEAGILEEWQLSHILCIQYEGNPQNKRLGTLVVELGYTTREAIEEALKAYHEEKKESI